MKFICIITLLSFSSGATIASAQITNFKHVVVIVQENRTPDNLFQGLCSPPFGFRGLPGLPGSCSITPSSSQYNIQTKDWKDGGWPGTIQPNPVSLTAPYDLDHTHAAFLAMCDRNPVTNVCQMDGAAGIRCAGSCPPKPQFAYVTNTAGVLNPYLELATQYGWANYMFQTNQGPSYPAHLYLFGGTSAPSAFDDKSGIFAAENPSGGFTPAGCASPPQTTVALIDRSGQENQQVYPCFEHKTLADVLPKSVSWKYYAPGANTIWTAPNSIEHICGSTGKGGHCGGSAWMDHLDLNPSDVLKDIDGCQLSSLSWVVPSGQNSDHAEHNDGGGPSWVAAIVNALGNSKSCDEGTGYWKDTAIIITWDDWGGWYDHEPPVLSTHSEYEHGFRVPLIVVSAYTTAGYVNNSQQDFGSILRFIEHNFGVEEGSLQFADARAQSDLGLFFNLRAAPRSYTNISAQKSAAFFLNDSRAMADPDDQ